LVDVNHSSVVTLRKKVLGGLLESNHSDS
jgi:hypothetical protein